MDHPPPPAPHDRALDDPPAESAPPPDRAVRDPGGPASRFVAWCALLGLLVITVGAQWAAPAAAPAAAMDEVPSPQGAMLVLARYSVGAAELAAGAGEQLLPQLDAVAASSTDRLRVAMLTPALADESTAVERLDAVVAELLDQRAAADERDDTDDDPGDSADPAPEGQRASGAAEAIDAERSASSQRNGPRMTPDLIQTLLDDARLARLRFTDGDGALTADQRDRLMDRHGWYAKVAVTYDREASDALRQEAFGKATQVMLMLIGLLGAVGLGFVVGLGLLTFAAIHHAGGRLRPRYAPPAPGGSVYLETFALFIAGFLLIQFIGGAVAATAGVDLMPLLIWLLLLIAFWPLLRGAPFAHWRYAVGWHTGRGVIREISAGVVGYIAGLPILAAGIGLVLLLSQLAQFLAGGPTEPPSHPIVQEVGQGGVWGLLSIYLLAAVWAPVVEETMFRGAFYHHLRGRMGALLSAVVVGFIFAVIHPQGWIAVPALMSLAIVFALLREWRGSIIAPAVAHALNNGVVVTMLFVAIR